MKIFGKFLTGLLLAALPMMTYAQRRSEIISVSELPTNYSIETMNVGSDGTKFVRVSGFGRKDDAAAFNARRNAIHAAIFRGLPAAVSANATPPLCTDPAAMTIYKTYFDKFFSSGEYIKYVNITTDGVPSGADRIKVKGGYEVYIYVQVMFDQLRAKLEKDNVIKALKKQVAGKLPTIMVVPSDAWCVRNGYVIEFGGQRVPDYAKALSTDADIRALVSAMGDFMAKENYPTQSLEQEIKRINAENIELSMLTGKESGAGIVETPIETLRRSAKADIILDLDIIKKKVGPRTQISFNLTALDAYTSKIISGNVGAGSNSTAPVVTLLEESFLSYKDNFLSGLKSYYKNIEDNGREIVVALKCFDSAPFDFEEIFDYNGIEAELADIISVWFELNSIGGAYTEQERSANSLRYTQVRMPLFGKSLSGKEVAIDATAFVRSLALMLRKEPYNVEVKTYQKGLGEVWLILGEK